VGRSPEPATTSATSLLLGQFSKHWSAPAREVGKSNRSGPGKKKYRHQKLTCPLPLNPLRQRSSNQRKRVNENIRPGAKTAPVVFLLWGSGGGVRPVRTDPRTLVLGVSGGFGVFRRGFAGGETEAHAPGFWCFGVFRRGFWWFPGPGSPCRNRAPRQLFFWGVPAGLLGVPAGSPLRTDPPHWFLGGGTRGATPPRGFPPPVPRQVRDARMGQFTLRPIWSGQHHRGFPVHAARTRPPENNPAEPRLPRAFPDFKAFSINQPNGLPDPVARTRPGRDARNGSPSRFDLFGPARTIRTGPAAQVT